MVSVNTAMKRDPVRTHEGGATVTVKPLEALRRSVLTCLLWEDSYYEKGNETAQRIAELVTLCDAKAVAALAVEARSVMQLRHVPLLLVRELARVKGNGSLVAETLAAVVQRPDEITEYLAIYWRDGRCPISAGSKRGLRVAFGTFSRYQIAKYRDDDKRVKLSDALRVVRPKARDAEQNAVYQELRKGTLAAVDTWESELSAGKGKRETFERLIAEKKLGGMAALRNLRNMQESGVPDAVIRERLAAPMPRVWPYRFVVAAKYAPMLEDALEGAMLRSVSELAKLGGVTGLLVDVSGSMDEALGKQGKGADRTTRIDVAAGLAILLREKAEAVKIATFSNALALLPPRRGFALRDGIVQSQAHGGTNLRAALDKLQPMREWADVTRVIVITDEQSSDGIAAAWLPQSYVINVASYQHGVGYHSGWTHIEGWSDRVFDYIAATEAQTNER